MDECGRVRVDGEAVDVVDIRRAALIRRGHDDVLGIEQKRAVLGGAPKIDRAVEFQIAQRRHLGEAALARRVAADLSAEHCCAVGPRDDTPGVTARGRIDRQRGPAVHKRHLGAEPFAEPALIAADIDIAATGRAARVQIGAVDTDPPAEDLDITTAAGRVAGVDVAAHRHRAAGRARDADRIAPDHRGVVKRQREVITHTREYLARAGVDDTVVLDADRARVRRVATDPREDPPPALAEQDVVPGGHRNHAVRRDDPSKVRDPTTNQVGLAGRVDCALVDHRSRQVGELVDIVQEVLVGDVARGGVDPAHVDHGVLPEEDTRPVHEVDITVGEYRTVDQRRGRALDPVQNPRRRTGLHEPDGFVLVQVERVIVDDRAIARRDRRVVAGAVESGRPVDDLLATGTRQRRDAHHARDHTRGDQPARARTITAILHTALGLTLRHLEALNSYRC